MASAWVSESFLFPPSLRALLGQLHKALETKRRHLLRQRKQRLGLSPSFSSAIRKSTWQVRPLPPQLQKRHVEITGPAEPKITINALHSGADAFMADLEDALTPHWENQLKAQETLYHAARGTLRYLSPEGKTYQLDPHYSTLLLMRPRGLHLLEKHYLIQDKPIAASFFDTATYLYHNAEALLKRGAGPYLYLPKIESREEAALWEALLCYCEEYLGLPIGTVRVTVLIETFPAAFQAEEILYELREHIAGLNAGRWDYLFSLIKFYHKNRGFILPPRESLTMDQPFLQAYAEEVVRAAHRRGALAIGGMSAFIPDRKNPDLNARAIEQVKKDKTRELSQGFDGAWVAHPDLVPIVKKIFEEGLNGKANQVEKLPKGSFDPESLQAFPLLRGPIPLESVRRNIEVCLLYLNAWLNGQGAVALFHLMEDTATAEIARAQLWQWLFAQPTPLQKETQEPISIRLYEKLIHEVQTQYPTLSSQAAQLLRELLYTPTFIPFLTTYAYQRYIP
ncbi:MAG: malate synthase [Bacteroidia bacterium]|nr:malate synthase [Bacteroidia bacterium]GIV23596.1 MAG: malate synthase [Bacteroidia bacterium]